MAIFTESRGWSRAWSRGHVVIFTEVTRLFLNLHDVFLLQNQRLGDFQIGNARKNSKIRVHNLAKNAEWSLDPVDFSIFQEICRWGPYQIR